MNKTKKKPIVALIFLIILGVGGYFGKEYLLKQKPVDDTLTLYGNIDIRDAQLAFNEQEIVKKVFVEEGNRVQQGQLLAKLKTDCLVLQLKEAKAEYVAQKAFLRKLINGTRKREINQAKAKLDAAKVHMQNTKRLVKRLEKTSKAGATPEQDLDDAKANFDIARADLNVRKQALELALEGYRKEEIAQAKAQVQAKQAHVAFLQQRIKDTVLRAPSNGVIQSRILEPGEMAMPSRPAFVLALTDPKWVRAYLPEPELGRIKANMQAMIYSDSFSDRFFKGHVGFISPQAEFTPKSVQTTQLRPQLVYEVRIWVDDPGDELRLGMPVTVKILENNLDPTNNKIDKSPKKSGSQHISKPASKTEVKNDKFSKS